MQNKEDMEENKNTKDMVPEQGGKSNRELLLERIRAKYPDEDLADEDAVYGKAMTAYDEDHDRLKAIYKDNAALVDRLKQDPATAMFVADVLAGKIPPAAVEYMVENYKSVEDDPAYSEFNARREADRTRRAEIERMAEEYANNIAASEKEIQAFSEQEGMTEDEVKDIISQAQTLVFEPLATGKFTAKTLAALRDLVTMDEKIAMADEAGYVRGRNEKIVERKAKIKGDGLPAPEGSVSKPQAKADPLGGIGLKKDAFELGGYKRV